MPRIISAPNSQPEGFARPKRPWNERSAQRERDRSVDQEESPQAVAPHLTSQRPARHRHSLASINGDHGIKKPAPEKWVEGLIDAASSGRAAWSELRRQPDRRSAATSDP